MKNSLLILCALLFGAPFAGARGGGRGFSGGHGSGGRGFSAARGSTGIRASSSSRGFSGGFSRGSSRPAFGRATSFRAAARPSASHSSRNATGRATFHAAASRSTRRLSGADAGDTSAPAWATPGAMIRTAGQPPAYSDPGNGGTHSVEGGGFIAMDQSRANDVGRSPGITWGAPARAAASRGGGSGASSNGPAFDPSF